MRAQSKKPTTGVAWEPPPTSERPDWSAVADELRSHPYEWMKVYERDRASWAVAVTTQHVKAVRASLGFEYRTTDNTRSPNRTCTFYMRFNPDKVDPLAELVSSNRKD